MLPSIRFHAQYQSFVLEQLRTHYSGGILVLVAKDWTFIEKFWLVDLSGTASVLSRQYATRGIHATDLLHSYLLMLQESKKAIQQRGALANVYHPCPCGSGKKYKFCCAQKPIEFDL